MALTSESVIQRNTEIISSEIDGETVMMDTDFEKYFGMRAVGTRIWQLLENETSVEQLCKKLTDEFDVTFEQCLQDTLPFLQDLLKQQMVELK